MPAIGDFARSATVPEPTAIALWDGRVAGADAASAGQGARRLVFFIPRELSGGVLVLSGKVEARYRVDSLPAPAAAT